MRRYILVIGLVLIVALGIILLWPRGNSKKVLPTKATNLTDYATTDSQVSMTTDGPIVSEQAHRAIRISVNRNLAKIEVTQGYEGNVIKSQEYPNTQNAYTAFLYALNSAQFTATKPVASGVTEQGSCPLGQRYSYELMQGAQQKLDSWSTSCGKATGTFNGISSTTRQLFQGQIPDYSTFVSGVHF